jgi:hypothetical protein
MPRSQIHRSPCDVGYSYGVPASPTSGKNRRVLAKICATVTLDTLPLRAGTIYWPVKSCEHRKVTLRSHLTSFYTGTTPRGRRKTSQIGFNAVRRPAIAARDPQDIVRQPYGYPHLSHAVTVRSPCGRRTVAVREP